MACERCGNIYATSIHTCQRCSTPPVPLAPPQPGPFRSPRYDNVAMLEGFLLGIVAAWSAAPLGLVVAALAFFGSWGAFVVLFMFFPRPVTVVATLAWAVLAGAIAGWMTENNWLWMVAAGGLAGMVSIGAHMRALVVLKGGSTE
jgi:hypothetical protein